MFHSFMENFVFSASISDLFLLKTVQYKVHIYTGLKFHLTVIVRIKIMCEKLIVRLKK